MVSKLQLQLFSGNPPCWSNLQIVHLPILRNDMSQMLNKNTGFPAGSVSLKNLSISICHVPGTLGTCRGTKEVKLTALLELMILSCVVNSESMGSSNPVKERQPGQVQVSVVVVEPFCRIKKTPYFAPRNQRQPRGASWKWLMGTYGKP